MEQKQVIEICKMSDNASIPFRNTEHSAGLDLLTAYDYCIRPNEICRIKTDLQIKIPPDSYGQISSRSSCAIKGLITLAGIIDADFRGNIVIVVINLSRNTIFVSKKDRIAQLIIIKIYNQFEISEVEKLDDTSRGAKGFGSSGR